LNNTIEKIDNLLFKDKLIKKNPDKSLSNEKLKDIENKRKEIKNANRTCCTNITIKW
jgi:hypothetical protein